MEVRRSSLCLCPRGKLWQEVSLPGWLQALVASLVGRHSQSPPVTYTLGPEGPVGKGTAEADPLAVAPGKAGSEALPLTPII